VILTLDSVIQHTIMSLIDLYLHTNFVETGKKTLLCWV